MISGRKKSRSYLTLQINTGDRHDYLQLEAACCLIDDVNSSQLGEAQ